MSDGTGPESKKGTIEAGIKMPDTRPSSVSRIAVGRTVRTIPTSEGQKAVQFSTLPSDTILLAEGDHKVSVHSTGEDANRRLEELEEETGHSVEAGLLGFVQPGEEDDEKVNKEFVVVQVGRKEVDDDPTSQGSIADGQRMTLEGESLLVDKFVQAHPDLFPAVPGAEVPGTEQG